jgi:DHA2 family multidrug resistance protein
MAHFNVDMPAGPVVWAGVIQGLGLGLVFVPVSTIAYATLPAARRTEAAGLFSLARNIGSSIGIALVFALLARWTQVNHADLAARLSPFGGVLGSRITGGDTAALVALNGEVTRQAAAIAYLNDFWLMMAMTLASIPLLLLLRPPARAVAAAPIAAVADH